MCNNKQLIDAQTMRSNSYHIIFQTIDTLFDVSTLTLTPGKAVEVSQAPGMAQKCHRNTISHSIFPFFTRASRVLSEFFFEELDESH